MSHPRAPATLRVPTGWSVEQVTAVLDFLEDVHAAIFEAYDDVIAAAEFARPDVPLAKRNLPDQPPDPDDESPF